MERNLDELPTLWSLIYCLEIHYRDKLAIVCDEVVWRSLLEGDAATVARQLNTENRRVTQLLDAMSKCKRNLNTVSWLNAIHNGDYDFVPYGDANYPSSLSEIDDPPLGLWYRGQLPQARQPAIAVVGSRKATPYGLSQCARFCRFLTESGLTIVSGLAYGIDTQAHESCIECNGTTIAVLGSGIARVYPYKNLALANSIVDHAGCLLSEYPPHEAPLAWHFPERNRLISALAHGVIVVEATLKSGSLITASRAANQSREVFAVPGCINTHSSAGCHQLIKDGAVLIDAPEDILHHFDIEIATPAKPPQPEPHPLITLLRGGPLHIDKIVQISGLTPAEVSSMLTTLELSNSIARHKNGLYYLK